MRAISISEDRDWISEPSESDTNRQEAKCKGMAKKGRRGGSSKKEDENLQQIIWEEVAKEHGMGGPCTECGITTSNWCDGGARKGNDCTVGSSTALCTNCDKIHDKCHVCRGVALCPPPEWSGISEPERKHVAIDKMMRIIDERARKEREAEQESIRNSFSDCSVSESEEAKCTCGEERAACGVCGRGWAQLENLPRSPAERQKSESEAKKGKEDMIKGEEIGSIREERKDAENTMKGGTEDGSSSETDDEISRLRKRTQNPDICIKCSEHRF